MKKKKKNENGLPPGYPPPPFLFVDPDAESRKNLPSEAPKIEEEIPENIKAKDVDEQLTIEIDTFVPEMELPRPSDQHSSPFRDKLKYILVVFVIIATVITGAMIIYDRLTHDREPLVDNSPVKGKNLVVSYAEDQLSVRSDWNDTQSVVYLAKTTSSTLGFELQKMFLCDKNAQNSQIPEQQELLADLSKSVKTLTFYETNYQTVGLNDGWDYAVNIYAKSHSVKEKDIGSIFIDSSKRKFTIIKIVDKDNFIVFPSYVDYTKKGFKFALPSSKLEYVYGESGLKTIEFQKAVKTQLYPFFNNVSCEMDADAQPIDITNPGSLQCSDFIVTVSMDVLNLPVCVRALELNTGKNRNETYHSNNLKDKYMTLTYSYQFSQNGSCSLKVGITARADINLSGIGGFMLPIKNGVYIPNTAEFCSIGTSFKQTVDLTAEKWSDPLTAPHRFYTFTSDEHNKGICVGICPYAYSMTTEKRRVLVDRAARIDPASRTVIPYVISKNAAINKGEKFEFVSYIVPFEKNSNNFSDTDLTALSWYWANNEIYLMIDSHKAVDKDIALPLYMKNMAVTPVDVSANTKVSSQVSADGKIHLKVSSDYGYAVVKLTIKS